MSNKYQAYAEYKDSGVEWLGEVPVQWNVCAIKYIVSIPITDGPHETPNFFDSGVPFISAEAISTGRIDFEKIRAHISEEDNEKYSKKYCPKKYDIYMVKSGATTGITAIVETDIKFNIWSPLAVIRCSEYFSPYFVLNFLRSLNFKEAIELNWSFGTQQNIGMGVIENLHIAKPSINEQQKIANFLGHETSKIDTLIEKQQQLIQLLKEKRQAVISHAVTKGLNPNVPMRDSGVEWLGEVPEHWDVKPLKCVCDLIDGDRSSVYPNENDLVDDGIPFVSSKNIVNYKLTKKNLNYITREKFGKLSRGKLIAGDLVITVRGTIGHVGIFDPEIIGCETGFINAQMMIIRPINGLTDYLQLISESSLWQSQLNVAAYGSTIKQLSNEVLGNICIAIPSFDELLNFVQTLRLRCEKIEHLIFRAQTAIELMQERRTALISAAVTGKIDLRNWQAPNKETREASE